jgi:hypothetical protein
MASARDSDRRRRIHLLELEIAGESRRINRLEANSRFRSPANLAMDLARARGRRRRLEEELQELRTS